MQAWLDQSEHPKPRSVLRNKLPFCSRLGKGIHVSIVEENKAFTSLAADKKVDPLSKRTRWYGFSA